MFELTNTTFCIEVPLDAFWRIDVHTGDVIWILWYRDQVKPDQATLR
jgi:hypothetical protein